MARIWPVLAAALFWAALPARAEEQQDPSGLEQTVESTLAAVADQGTEPRWGSTISLYGWFPLAREGSSTVADQEVPVDLDFGDPGEPFSWAAGGRVESWMGRWAALLDVQYAELGSNQPIGAVDSKLEITQWNVDVAGGFRVLEPKADGFPMRIEVFLGGRYVDLSQALELVPGGPSNESEQFFDLFLGVRFALDLGRNWTIELRADAGGFGWFGGSDLTINAWFTVAYHFGGRTGWSLLIGYRYYQIDYTKTLDSGVFAIDMRMHGPVIAVAYSF
jgi:hypothetical protein